MSLVRIGSKHEIPGGFAPEKSNKKEMVKWRRIYLDKEIGKYYTNISVHL